MLCSSSLLENSDFASHNPPQFLQKGSFRTSKAMVIIMDFKQRAHELVSQMTLEEKAGQLRYDAIQVERLGIPAYNWWNEALHGTARNGTATVLPQAIAMSIENSAPPRYIRD